MMKLAAMFVNFIENVMNSFLDNFRSLESQRKNRLKQVPEGALKRFLSVPIADLTQPIANFSVLAVDFETTGLDPDKDSILSVGFVQLQNNSIKLDSCYHQIITAQKALDPSNVTIHKITDQASAEGEQLEKVVESLLDALAGKVMLVHYAQIERQFLSKACLQIYGVAPVFPVIDTLALAKKRYDRLQECYQPTCLHLANLRAEYGLPYHKAHNALNDAIATAELFIAKIQHSELGGNTSLKSVIS